MSEDIKGLIEKINREGIKQAEEKAAQITAEAKKQAQLILYNLLFQGVYMLTVLKATKE